MDAVIVWSDTVGKEYRSKRLEYFNDLPRDGHALRGGRGKEELFFCIASIVRNADFVDRIILVTEEDRGHGLDFIRKNFPMWKGELRVVPHVELFCGLEGFLPCFSPIAVRTLLYRVGGLSEDFLLVNPGCIPLKKLDLGAAGGAGPKPVIFGTWERAGRLMRKGTRSFFIGQEELYQGHRRFSGNAGRRAPGERRGRFCFLPSPHPVLLSRKILTDCLESSSGLMKENLQRRFNSPEQRDITAEAANSGRMECRSDLPATSFVVPADNREFGRMLRGMDDSAFVCGPPLSHFREEQSAAVRDCLRALLRIEAWN
jgi:hypothetical protein